MIEVLITVVVVGLIATSIGNAVIVSLNGNKQSTEALSYSGSALFGGVNFASDTQEAIGVGASGIATTGVPSCGTGTLVVDFTGDGFGQPPVSPATAPTAYKSYVSYVTEVEVNQSGANTLRLVRNACWELASGPLPPALSPRQRMAVVGSLSTTAPPTVTCYKRSANPATILGPSNIVTPCSDPLALMVVINLTTINPAKTFQLIGTRRTA